MTTTPDNSDARSREPSKTAGRFEPGSNNLLGVYALSASLSLVEELGMAYIERELEARVSYLLERLAEHERIRLTTPAPAKQRAGIVAFQVNAADHGKLHRQLLEKRVVCALRGGAIRFSPHYYTSINKLNKSLDILYSYI